MLRGGDEPQAHAPPKKTFPSVGSSRPAMSLSSVVLPAPSVELKDGQPLLADGADSCHAVDDHRIWTCACCRCVNMSYAAVRLSIL